MHATQIPGLDFGEKIGGAGTHGTILKEQYLLKFIRRIFANRILSRAHLVGAIALVTVLYGLFYWVFGEYLKALLPESVIKAMKFSAFILASYPMWQTLYMDKHKAAMLTQAAPGNPDDEKQYAVEQLKLIAGDEKRGIILSIASFTVLALLAGFGEV